jgi:hypothetical protein
MPPSAIGRNISYPGIFTLIAFCYSQGSLFIAWENLLLANCTPTITFIWLIAPTVPGWRRVLQRTSMQFRESNS